jgi:hypothetical protein|tara:strand:+ start:84 stop:557 length:474 start_codon:yes stop_codon:yes gene_type:complete
MIDPISAFAVASAAYSSFRKIIGHAQDLEGVSKQLGSWYSACADINRAEAQRKSPTFFERATQGQSIEEEALQILIHKKTLKEREVEIKNMLDLRFGFGTYDEMLGMRREIRAEREKTAFAQDEAKRQIQNNMAILGLSILIIGILGGGVYMVSLVI